MSAIIRQEELLEATGYERPRDLEKCLKRQGIKFFYGKGGRIWTTPDILAKIAEAGTLDDPIEFEP